MANYLYWSLRFVSPVLLTDISAKWLVGLRGRDGDRWTEESWWYFVTGQAAVDVT